MQYLKKKYDLNEMKSIRYSLFKNGLVLLGLVFTVLACEGMNTSKQDRLVARAENHYLYRSDIERYMKLFNSKEDSLVRVSNFINTWAHQKLLYEKSMINLPIDQIAELNDLVNEYESSLFTNAYREFVLKSSMDTLLVEDAVNEYYHINKQNFKLKEPVYKIRYISLPLDNVDRREITKRFKKFDGEDIVFLDSLSFQFSNYFLSDSIWLNGMEIRDQLYFLDERQQERFLKTPNYYEVKDSLVLYLLSLVERLDRGSIAPLSYVENTIKDVVFNKRKIKFLRYFDNNILQDAIKTKKFEKY